MDENQNHSPDELSNDELLSRVKELARQERGVTSCLVAHLAELDLRELYLAEGCSSLFTYCVQVLHLSEHAAYGRIEAARAARVFPRLLDLLRAGDITLTTIVLLAPHLTGENVDVVLEAARGRTRREISELVARIRPLPPVSSSLRKVASVRRLSTEMALAAAQTEAGAPDASSSWDGSAGPRGDVASGVGAVSGSDGASGVEVVSGSHGAPVVSDPDAGAALVPASAGTARPAAAMTTASRATGPRSYIEPLSPEFYRLQMTLSGETIRYLRQAQELLRHQIPSGDPAEVLNRALRLLVENLSKRKFAATLRPRDQRGRHTHPECSQGIRPVAVTGPASRYIPAHVRRQVWERDQGQCAFVSAEGRRCTERAGLEYHHLKPFAKGGQTTTANLELRCRPHNGYEAWLSFGPAEAPLVKDAPLARKAPLAATNARCSVRSTVPSAPEAPATRGAPVPW
jgi:hypothetical protein